MPGVSRKRDLGAGSIGDAEDAVALVCGTGETIARSWPTAALKSVDLPTFGRPMRATVPAR